MPQIEFVTVIHNLELDILKAQARSIAKNVDPDCVSKIFLIANDPDLDHGKLREIIKVYDEFIPKVLVLSSEEVAPCLAWKKGWWAQQVLKLRAAEFMSTDYYVVLDSKNQLIKPISIDSFFNADNKVKTWFHSYRNNAESHCRGSFDYFGIDAEPYINCLPPSITPIIMSKEIVLRMIKKVESSTSSSFEQSFLSCSDTTEFLLYYAFMIEQGIDMKEFYEGVEQLVSTLFLDKLKDKNTFDSIINKALLPSTIAFGVHRAVIPELKEWHKQRIYEVWMHAGLSNDKKEMQEWLNPA